MFKRHFQSFVVQYVHHVLLCFWQRHNKKGDSCRQKVKNAQGGRSRIICQALLLFASLFHFRVSLESAWISPQVPSFFSFTSTLPSRRYSSPSSSCVAPPAAPSLSGLPFWDGEGEQRRGLHEEEFPRDARLHETLQPTHNARGCAHAKVRVKARPFIPLSRCYPSPNILVCVASAHPTSPHLFWSSSITS